MELKDFIQVCEVDAGEFVVGELFRRKFGDAPPDVPHHIVTFYRAAPQHLVALSYVHFRPFGDICLVGGACTDGRGFAAMTPAQCDLVRAGDGLYFAALRFAFERLAPRFEAFFGYCGDARALEVDLHAGFRRTEHDKLLIHVPRPLHPNIERALVAKAHALGPF